MNSFGLSAVMSCDGQDVLCYLGCNIHRLSLRMAGGGRLWSSAEAWRSGSLALCETPERTTGEDDLVQQRRQAETLQSKYSFSKPELPSEGSCSENLIYWVICVTLLCKIYLRSRSRQSNKPASWKDNFKFVKINQLNSLWSQTNMFDLFSTVCYLEQVDDQRASVAQVINNLEIIDVTVHWVGQLDKHTHTKS